MRATQPVVDRAKSVLTEFCSALSGSAFCWWSFSLDRGGWVLHYAASGQSRTVVIGGELLEDPSRWPAAAELFRAQLAREDTPHGELPSRVPAAEGTQGRSEDRGRQGAFRQTQRGGASRQRHLDDGGGTLGLRLRIELERSGGLTDIRRSVKVDTAELVPERAEELRHLVAAADLGTFSENPTPLAGRRDRYIYRLTVEDESNAQSVTVSEDAASKEVRRLVDWLQQTAEPR